MCLRGGLGAGERARYLTALHALTEDPGSVPSTCVVLITAVWGDTMFSSDIHGYQARCGAHTHVQAKHSCTEN